MPETPNFAVLEQLPPQHSKQLPVYRILVRQARDLNWNELAIDLEMRAEIGRQRYGTYLCPNNGRNALIDAYQELLDAALYLEQARQEGAADRELALLVLHVAHTVRVHLNGSKGGDGC